MATSKLNYDITRKFRMTKSDSDMLHEKATRFNMTDSAYIRFLISQKPNDYPEIRKLLKELINEINHIGININQIVKNHNSEFYSEEDKTRLFAYMRKLNTKVDEAVRMIGNQ